MNYLIDEASDVHKGANTTISYVHHYFENHGLGETCVHLHASNCSGKNKNKNNYFIWYLTWRTIDQLHHSINYSFFIAGHTKFGPDRCFGIIVTFSTRVLSGNLKRQTGGGHVIRPCSHVQSSQRTFSTPRGRFFIVSE